jgi:hypothetical protein
MSLILDLVTGKINYYNSEVQNDHFVYIICLLTMENIDLPVQKICFNGNWTE